MWLYAPSSNQFTLVKGFCSEQMPIAWSATVFRGAPRSPGTALMQRKFPHSRQDTGLSNGNLMYQCVAQHYELLWSYMTLVLNLDRRLSSILDSLLEHSSMNHRVKPARNSKTPVNISREALTPPAWPSYQGTSQLVGTSPSGRVTVYVDPSLGDPGLQNAQDLLNDADRVANANDGIFGTTGGPVSVIVFALGGATDGTGGADHMGCDYVNGAAIEVDAAFGNSVRVSALFEAELSECSMNGNLCGESTGEALSRWCAAFVSNNALADFATAPLWFQDGMPDYVDQTDNTDQNADSTGCGMAFISWLISQGYSLSQIAPAMVNLGDAGTFAELYGNLTSDDPANAWSNFQNAINSLPNGVTSDDPFNGLGQPAQIKHLSPRSAELVGRIFASLVSDLAAGRHADQIAANVRAAMLPALRPNAPPICKPGSKRLLPPEKAGKRSKSA